MRFPDREQIDQAAAVDVDQVLGEKVVSERHRAAAEAKQRKVRRLAWPLAEGGVEAAGLLRGVATGGRQDADPRPSGRPSGRQAQEQLAYGAIGRARREFVAA